MTKSHLMETFHEPTWTAEAYSAYLRALEAYFASSGGTNLAKLENFAKYVPRGALTRFIIKYELFKKVLTTQGSVVECGVLFGGGLMTWAQLSAILEPANHQRRIIGFDTFSGFPEIGEEDSKSTSEFARTGGLAVDSYDDLQKAVAIFDMARHMGHIDKVRLVKGDIRETLPKFIEDNPHLVVSLLYLDVDLYDPTREAIKRLLPRMPKGAVIVFDQLNVPTFSGETLAVLTELGINRLKIERFPIGTSISYAVLE